MALAGLPVLLPEYLQSLATLALVFGIFAMSLDFLLGYAGMISLGHAAYLGIGGYVAAVLMIRMGISSAWIGIPAAVICGGLGAAIAGVIALRLAGVYFMLVTFALGQLAYSVAQKWPALTTSGAEGISGIVYPDLSPLHFDWTTLTFYEFVLVLLIGTYWLLRRIVWSPFGVTVSAIRQNEQRMLALGYRTWLFRLGAFVLAGAVAGGAGALFAYQSGIMVPADLSVLASGTAVFMVLLGGPRTLYGPILGAIVLTGIQYYGSVYLPSTWPLVLGGLFVVIVMLTRDGLVGVGRRLLSLAQRRPWR